MKKPMERDRARARKRRGLRAGRTVFSILLAAVLCVMVGCAWDAVGGRGTGGSAAKAETAATAAPAATVPAPEALETNDPVEVPTMATEPEPALEPSEEPAEVTTAAWPAQRFPGVPAYPGELSVSYLAEGLAQILLEPGDDAGFADYAAELVRLGASTHVNNDRLTVLKLGDVEIQLIPDEEAPAILLCGENAIFWDDPEDVLPAGGRLVAREEGEDGLGAVLTYRCVSLSGLMDYLDLLRREGWTPTAPAIPVDGALFATYQRGDRAITIDYYANSSNFQIFVGSRAL
ncbi:MAG: hypothetical protein GX592_04570 [Clostridiales bacterium]|nr:hypothetical protein [Clostridiales bacterium]